MSIRQAGEADLDRLQELAATTFRQAFARQNDPLDLEAYVDKAFSRDAVRLELADPASVFLLAQEGVDALPVGYAKLRSGAPDPAVTGARPLEIQRMYVVGEGAGRGIGGALMKACLEEASRRGAVTVWLGVWEHNPRAIAFYRNWGFVEVGDHSFRLGGSDQRDLLMQRSVNSGHLPRGGEKPINR